MQDVLLIRYGEVHLKGQNRPFFMRALHSQLSAALRPLGGRVEAVEGRFIARGLRDREAGIEAACRIFGVHSVSPAVSMDKDFDAICAQAVRMLSGTRGSFKIKARRSDKRFPLESPEICERVGGYVQEALGLDVDVHAPDTVLEIEIRECAYLHMRSVPGQGGMPVGTNGRACLLLSGGIDSPVAGYRILKRGVELMAVHFHSHPFTSEHAKQKVIDLARILAGYSGCVRVFVVPFTELQQEIHLRCPEEETTVLMRRYMMRIAERVARTYGAQALVTGESIGQVASQTMESLVCTDAVVDMPVFRPLIGMDKREIIQEAERIGTLATSNLPYEDCCTIFTPRHPVIKPRKERLEKSEALIDGEALMQRALEGIERIDAMPE